MTSQKSSRPFCWSSEKTLDGSILVRLSRQACCFELIFCEASDDLESALIASI